MDIVVTGGTGFVGRALVRALITEGHRVRRVRRPHPGNQAAGPAGPADGPGSVTDVFADPLATAALATAMAGADAVIHLIGIISECGLQTFERVHVETTRSVVEAARVSRVPRFVHMSALGTRGGAPSRYHATKWEAETLVRESGLAWTIFRPSMIYGAEDGFTRLFARLSRFSPVLPLIGGGKNRLQPIAVEQVAQAFARALVVPASIGATLDLGGDEQRTFRELLSEILAALERRRLLVSVPWVVARWQAALLEWVWPTLLHQAPPLNRAQILMLQEDNVGDARTANALFGLRHASFRDGIRTYLGA